MPADAGQVEVEGARQTPGRAAPPPALPAGEELQVLLLTAGPGPAIWEHYGHNAIVIVEPARGVQIAYHYGLFEFDEGFFGKYLRGEMRYSMGVEVDLAALIDSYQQQGRTLWLQHLDLDPAQRRALLEFLDANMDPALREYDYDYYFDNCSTRLRDALDRALGGTLSAALRGRPGETLRFHTRRLGALGGVVPYLTLLYFLGMPLEQPGEAWQECFLPTSLAAHLRTIQRPGNHAEGAHPRPLVIAEEVFGPTVQSLPPEPTAPPRWWPGFLAAGLVLGGLLAMAGRRRTQGARVLLGVGGALWSLVYGGAGALLVYFAFFTRHAATWPNWNLLQAAPLGLVTALLCVGVACGMPRCFAPARILAACTVALALFGLLVEWVPGWAQTNAEVVALCVPCHLGLWWGLHRTVALRRAVELRHAVGSQTPLTR